MINRVLVAGAGGAATLLAGSGLATVALLAVAPHLDPGLAARLPLWLAALALGGRLHVDGPAVGRLDPLRDGGLLGPPDATTDGPGHLHLTLLPGTLTLLAAAVVVLLLRRRPVPPVPAAIALGTAFAALGPLLALAGRTTTAGTTVAVTPGPAALGGAVIGAAAGLVGSGLARRDTAARFVAAYVGLLWAAGLLAGVVVAATGRSGALGTLISGSGVSGSDHRLGPLLVIGLLAAPTLAWDGAMLAVGVPLPISGAALSLQGSGSVTILGVARAVPPFALLPAAALAVGIGAAVVAYRPGHRTSLALTGIAPVAVAGLGRLAGLVALTRDAGPAREALHLAPALAGSLVWGIVVGVLLLAVSRAGGGPERPGRAAGRPWT